LFIVYNASKSDEKILALQKRDRNDKKKEWKVK